MKRIVLLFLLVLISVCQSAFAYDFSAVSPSGHTLYYSISYSYYGNSVTVTSSDYITGDLVIPSSVTNNGTTYYVEAIGAYAFAYQHMSSVVIPNTVTSIGEYAFSGCDMTSVTFPFNASYTIGWGAFSACPLLTSVDFRGAVTSIGGEAFESCSSLTSVTFADLGMAYSTSIGTGAFHYCTSLTSVTLSHVTSIGQDAFLGCSSLTSLTLGSSVDSILSDAFMSCNNLSEIFCQTSTAPMLEWDVFLGVPSTIPVYIPCGSTSSFQSSWTHFSNFVEMSFAYTLDLQVNDTTMGRAVFISRPNCQNTALIAAVTNPYYTFDFWSDGDTTNPRTITLTSNTSLVAHFSSAVRYEYLYINVYIHDTTYIDVHDTTYINVPYAVHDTTIITDTLTLTEYVPVHDTTIITDTVTLTEYVPVHDTTVVTDTVTLTEYVPVHDTTYINVPVHDTTYITQMDTVTVTEYVPVHDTTYITQIDTVTLTEYVPVHDTTYITQMDTVIMTQYDTITNTIFDTLTVTDTLWLTQTDTLWLHDTIIIHDTIYITQDGIDGVDALNAKVFLSQSQIVVEGADGNTVWLYDINGRVLATKQDDYTPLRFDVPVSGTYIIKIGLFPARKVVVIR